MTNEQFGYTSTRGRDKIHMLQPKTELGSRTFSFKGAQLYTSTAHQIKTLPALNVSVFPMVYHSVSLLLLLLIVFVILCLLLLFVPILCLLL